MLQKNKSVLFTLILISFVVFVSACSDNENINQSKSTSANSSKEKDNSQEYLAENNPVVTIIMENNDEIVVELYPEIAPNTVKNFISLIEKDFYDGLIFHRVIPGFMIQGGDPDGNGTGGPGYGIKGEFTSNGFENDLKHERGVVSMARSQSPDSAGSQFFIMTDDSGHLDNDYAGFGMVTEGLDVVDEIVSTDRDGNDKPEEDQRIKSITVDTKGIKYEEPETK